MVILGNRSACPLNSSGVLLANTSCTGSLVRSVEYGMEPRVNLTVDLHSYETVGEGTPTLTRNSCAQVGKRGSEFLGVF